MRPTPSLEPAPAYDSIVQITDEVWIAQRTATVGGSWYLLKLGKTWPRRSLRTKSLPDAKAKALKLYQEWLQDPDAVMAPARPAPRKSFKEVAEEWLAAQAKDKAYKAAIIRKFLVPFFQELRQLQSMVDLDQVMIDDYVQWRRTAYLQVPRDKNGQAVPPTALRISKKQFQTYAEPSPNTINRELPTLRQILKHAQRRGYFGGSAVPEVSPAVKVVSRRPAFHLAPILRIRQLPNQHCRGLFLRLGKSGSGGEHHESHPGE